jgi:hypothetical protein
MHYVLNGFLRVSIFCALRETCLPIRLKRYRGIRQGVGEYSRPIDKLFIFYWLGLENDDARFSSDDFWRK